jgi:hypothetical protein
VNEGLRGLALVRASLTEDADAINLLLGEAPITPDLARHLAAASAGLLREVLGPDEGLALVDRLMERVLQGDLS